jgi:hypothetical protein
MSRDKTYVLVLAVFAGIAVVLAAIGVYGVLSYFVNQRTRELGIRFALGAQRGDVFILVGRLGLTLAGTGLTIGIALALGLNRFMKEHLWLFHVKVTDPATYAAVRILQHRLVRVLSPCSPCHQCGSNEGATARVSLLHCRFLPLDPGGVWPNRCFAPPSNAPFFKN